MSGDLSTSSFIFVLSFIKVPDDKLTISPPIVGINGAGVSSKASSE